MFQDITHNFAEDVLTYPRDKLTQSHHNARVRARTHACNRAHTLAKTLENLLTTIYKNVYMAMHKSNRIWFKNKALSCMYLEMWCHLSKGFVERARHIRTHAPAQWGFSYAVFTCKVSGIITDYTRNYLEVQRLFIENDIKCCDNFRYGAAIKSWYFWKSWGAFINSWKLATPQLAPRQFLPQQLSQLNRWNWL